MMTPQGLEERFKLGFTTERSVIKDDCLVRLQHGNGHLVEPGLDDHAVAGTGKNHGGKDLAQAPGGNHRHTLGVMTQTLG